MLGTTQRPTQLRTLAAALALTAGALLYFSDHDNIDRHWRIALVMVLSATLLVIWPPLRPSRGPGPKVALLLALVLGTGCTMRASHALMGAGLVTATSGAISTDRESALRPATISVGLAVFAVGWVLHQSDGLHGGSAPSQRVYTSIEQPPDSSAGFAPTAGEKLGIYRQLPSDHAMFTR